MRICAALSALLLVSANPATEKELAVAICKVRTEIVAIEVESARGDVEHFGREADRVGRMYRGGASSEQEYHEMQRQLGKAKSALARNEKRLIEAKLLEKYAELTGHFDLKPIDK